MHVVFIIFMIVFGVFSGRVGASTGQDIVIERPKKTSGFSAKQIVEEASRLYSLEHEDALAAFYASRDGRKYWGRRDAADFIAVIEDSWTHALNPASYHLALLRDNDLAPLYRDVLLSDAYLSYGQDISGIRVDPRAFKSHKRFWQQPLTVEALLQLLEDEDGIGDVLKAFTPRGDTYNRLRKELKRLVRQDAPAYESVLPIRVRGAIRPGDEHAAVLDIRVRLEVQGRSKSGSPDTVYDDALAAAVMRFQEENGLEADAIIGSGTLRAMNRTRNDKIMQILANLERLRWVPEEKPERFVVVNVPSAMLWAIDDGRVQIEMPVIVGRKKRPTNIFITEITGVRLNPTWTIPPTIKREDIVPKLAEDPYYLVNKGIELISTSSEGGGAGAMSLNPAMIEWASVTQDDLKNMRMVQMPGAHNPLGQVRVLMPNGYNIYLHDTNEKHLFNRTGRAASSGCVRLRRPYDMADFILAERKNWSRDDLDAVLDKGKMKDLFIRETIPVYLVYYTSWINEDGRVVYGHDVYGYDEKLIGMLSKLDEIFIPVDNN